MLSWFKQQKQPSPAPSGPDFGGIDSLAKAEDACRQGELARLMLVPIEFGGEDVGVNRVYVPPFAVEVKERIDRNLIAPLAAQGRCRHYAAAPAYRGRSFVPLSIRIEASGPGSFVSNVQIWGVRTCSRACPPRAPSIRVAVVRLRRHVRSRENADRRGIDGCG